MFTHRAATLTALLPLLGLPAAPAAPPADAAVALAVARSLAAAPPDGSDAPRLAEAADRLAGIPPAWALDCLGAFADATPAGANWLRGALDRAVERGAPAAADLAGYVADTARPARGRLLACAWLEAADPARAATVLAGLLDDPVLDLRRGAVEQLLATAAGADDAAALAIQRRALAAARDVDQVERIVGWLAEHGERVAVVDVLGFVRRWRVSEAFDNVAGKGFATAYPPEAALPGPPDATAWKPVTAAAPHGLVDLNAAVATRKGVLAYALAEVEMPRAGPAEVRIGSPCAVAVWVNGQPVLAHEIYHSSEAIDQYAASAPFQAGLNTVLVKCCQNEQTEPWAADWRFQLRICDPLGTPLARQAPVEAP